MLYFENTQFMKKLVDSKLDKTTISNMIHFLAINAKLENHSKDSILFRIGDKGEKFYIILAGKVSVLKPKQIAKMISVRDYLLLLNKLKSMDEIYLFEKIMNSNVETFFIKERLFNIIIDIVLKIQKLDQSGVYDITDDLFTLDKNDKDYKDLCEYIHIIKENKKYNFFVEEYEKIIELNAGFSFGDFALESTNRLRTATIKMDTDCSYAVIKQEDYGNCLLREKKNSKMKEFKFLYESFFPKTFDKDKFEKYYFYEFVYEEYNRGSLLDLDSADKKGTADKPNLDLININKINQNNQNFPNFLRSLYVIKEGQVEITINKSLLEINELIKFYINTDASLKAIGDFSNYEDFFSKKLKNNIEDLIKKRNFSVIKVGHNDILGLEEFYYKIPFVFSAKVISEKLLLYRLNEDGFMKIIDKEGISRKFMHDYAMIKISNKISRLINLKKIYQIFLEKEIQARNNLQFGGNNPYKIERKNNILQVFNAETRMISEKDKVDIVDNNNLKSTDSNQYSEKKPKIKMSLQLFEKSPNCLNLNNNFRNPSFTNVNFNQSEYDYNSNNLVTHYGSNKKLEDFKNVSDRKFFNKYITDLKTKLKVNDNYSLNEISNPQPQEYTQNSINLTNDINVRNSYFGLNYLNNYSNNNNNSKTNNINLHKSEDKLIEVVNNKSILNSKDISTLMNSQTKVKDANSYFYKLKNSQKSKGKIYSSDKELLFLKNTNLNDLCKIKDYPENSDLKFNDFENLKASSSKNNKDFQESNTDSSSKSSHENIKNIYKQVETGKKSKNKRYEINIPNNCNNESSQVKPNLEPKTILIRKKSIIFDSDCPKFSHIKQTLNITENLVLEDINKELNNSLNKTKNLQMSNSKLNPNQLDFNEKFKHVVAQRKQLEAKSQIKELNSKLGLTSFIKKAVDEENISNINNEILIQDKTTDLYTNSSNPINEKVDKGVESSKDQTTQTDKDIPFRRGDQCSFNITNEYDCNNNIIQDSNLANIYDTSINIFKFNKDKNMDLCTNYNNKPNKPGKKLSSSEKIQNMNFDSYNHHPGNKNRDSSNHEEKENVLHHSQNANYFLSTIKKSRNPRSLLVIKNLISNKKPNYESKTARNVDNHNMNTDNAFEKNNSNIFSSYKNQEIFKNNLNFNLGLSQNINNSYSDLESKPVFIHNYIHKGLKKLIPGGDLKNYRIKYKSPFKSLNLETDNLDNLIKEYKIKNENIQNEHLFFSQNPKTERKKTKKNFYIKSENKTTTIFNNSPKPNREKILIHNFKPLDDINNQNVFNENFNQDPNIFLSLDNFSKNSNHKRCVDFSDIIFSLPTLKNKKLEANESNDIDNNKNSFIPKRIKNFSMNKFYSKKVRK